MSPLSTFVSVGRKSGAHALGGRLEHGVLARDMVGRDGEVGVVLQELDDVQVRHPGLHLQKKTYLLTTYLVHHRNDLVDRPRAMGLLQEALYVLFPRRYTVDRGDVQIRLHLQIVAHLE